MNAIFSGRFDPPNLGHVMTAMRLLRDYSRVIIVILDYPKREGCTAMTAFQIFDTIFGMILPSGMENRVEIQTNNTHFGFIDEKELRHICVSSMTDIRNCVYVGGNEEVNKHIQSLGCIPVQDMPRIVLRTAVSEFQPDDQYIFESTKIRNKMAQGESLFKQYNIGGDDEH